MWSLSSRGGGGKPIKKKTFLRLPLTSFFSIVGFWSGSTLPGSSIMQFIIFRQLFCLYFILILLLLPFFDTLFSFYSLYIFFCYFCNFLAWASISLCLIHTLSSHFYCMPFHYSFPFLIFLLLYFSLIEISLWLCPSYFPWRCSESSLSPVHDLYKLLYISQCTVMLQAGCPNEGCLNVTQIWVYWHASSIRRTNKRACTIGVGIYNKHN